MKKLVVTVVILMMILLCACEKEYVYVCTGCDKIKSSDEMAVHNQYGSDGIIRKGTCKTCKTAIREFTEKLAKTMFEK